MRQVYELTIDTATGSKPGRRTFHFSTPMERAEFLRALQYQDATARTISKDTVQILTAREAMAALHAPQADLFEVTQ